MTNLKNIRGVILGDNVLADLIDKDSTLKIKFGIQMPVAIKIRVGMRRHVFSQFNSYDLGL